MDGLPQEVALYHALNLSGYRLGEIVYIVNRNAETLALKARPYVLFGNPLERTRRCVDNKYSYRVTDDGRVSFSDVDANLLDITIQKKSNKQDELPVLFAAGNYKSSIEPLFYSILDHGSSVRILIFTWNRLKESSFEIVLENRPFAELYEPALVLARNADTFVALGLMIRRKGVVQNLKNFLIRANTIRKQMRYKVFAHSYVEQLHSRGKKLADDILMMIVDTLSKRGPSFFTDDYDRYFASVRAETDSHPCPYCDRPVAQISKSDYLDHHSRTVGFCANCFNIYDLPSERMSCNLRLKLESQISTSSQARIELDFVNPYESPTDLVSYLWLWSSSEKFRGDKHLTNPTASARLGTSEHFRHLSTLVTDNLDQDTYAMYGFVLTTQDLFVASRKMTLKKTNADPH
jgi:hypothetical protein